MTLITLTSLDTCPLCKCRVRRWSFAGVRVNKRSLTPDGKPHLSAGNRRCEECGFELLGVPQPGERMVLDAKSAAEIEAIRARRWPDKPAHDKPEES